MSASIKEKGLYLITVEYLGVQQFWNYFISNYQLFLAFIRWLEDWKGYIQFNQNSQNNRPNWNAVFFLLFVLTFNAWSLKPQDGLRRYRESENVSQYPCVNPNSAFNVMCSVWKEDISLNSFKHIWTKMKMSILHTNVPISKMTPNTWTNNEAIQTNVDHINVVNELWFF